MKITPAEAMTQSPVTKVENGRLTMRKASLVSIVSWAYDRNHWDIVVPGWAEERPGQPTYDIDAKADVPVPQAQVKLMLQRLLAERFRFEAHHETREGVHKVLRVVKGSPKLPEAAAAAPGTPTVKNDRANSRIICTGASIAEFLSRLNVTGVGGPILDQTGLSGRYDFTLDYGKYIEDSDAEHRLNALAAAQITAMRELGLEVAEVKMPVDFLVVDHVEKTPIGN